MSRAWSWRNAILKSDLSATTKHVLLVISCHMNDMGEGCYPSTRRISELASLSERSVCTHIDAAAEASWLQVVRHGFDGQKWARHEYRPLWPEGTEIASVPSDKGAEPHAEGTEPSDKKALNDVQCNISYEHPREHQRARFEEFWSAYPNKVARKQCEAMWKRLKLDAEADAILTGLKRWKSCEQWQTARFIPHPSTFINQERWKSEPPAAKAKPGELRVREATTAEKLEAQERARFFEAMKVNPGKSEAEIYEIMRSNRDTAR